MSWSNRIKAVKSDYRKVWLNGELHLDYSEGPPLVETRHAWRDGASDEILAAFGVPRPSLLQRAWAFFTALLRPGRRA